ALSKRRSACIALALIACLGAIFWFVWPGTPKLPTIIFLGSDYQMPLHKGPWPDRWIPQKKSWAWVWKLKQGLFGRNRSLLLNAQVFTFADSRDGIMSAYGLQKPDLNSNNVQIWLIPEPELRVLAAGASLKERGQPLFSPAVTTGDRMQAQLFCGT